MKSAFEFRLVRWLSIESWSRAAVDRDHLADGFVEDIYSDPVGLSWKAQEMLNNNEINGLSLESGTVTIELQIILGKHTVGQTSASFQHEGRELEYSKHATNQP